jgi:hypothetical protein
MLSCQLAKQASNSSRSRALYLLPPIAFLPKRSEA